MTRAHATPPILPLDTTPESHRVQGDIYRRMGGRERLATMYRLSEQVRRLARAGIRSRHPAYTDAQVELAHARLVLGDALVRAVWPERDLVDP